MRARPLRCAQTSLRDDGGRCVSALIRPRNVRGHRWMRPAGKPGRLSARAVSPSRWYSRASTAMPLGQGRMDRTLAAVMVGLLASAGICFAVSPSPRATAPSAALARCCRRRRRLPPSGPRTAWGRGKHRSAGWPGQVARFLDHYPRRKRQRPARSLTGAPGADLEGRILDRLARQAARIVRLHLVAAAPADDDQEVLVNPADL